MAITKLFKKFTIFIFERDREKLVIKAFNKIDSMYKLVIKNIIDHRHFIMDDRNSYQFEP